MLFVEWCGRDSAGWELCSGRGMRWLRLSRAFLLRGDASSGACLPCRTFFAQSLAFAEDCAILDRLSSQACDGQRQLSHMLGRPNFASGHRKKAAKGRDDLGQRTNEWSDHDESQHYHAARRRRALRASDPPLEPQDEAVHLRQPRRHLHHRPEADPLRARRRLHLREQPHPQGRHRAVRGHQEAGPGGRR